MTPGARPPLRDALSSSGGRRDYVRRLFDTIAPRYDVITVALSFGMDRRWKRRLADMPGDIRGARVLDLACGTGDIAFEMARRGASVTALDVTRRMLQLARDRGRREGPGVRFVCGDMMALPLAEARFDIVTTGYGLRNVPEIVPAVREIARVLRPGGLLLSLDFNRPAHALIRGPYLAYLSLVGAALGLLLHRDPDTYRYIPESIRRYPGGPGVAEILQAEGFADSRFLPVLGGLMGLNVARSGGGQLARGLESA